MSATLKKREEERCASMRNELSQQWGMSFHPAHGASCSRGPNGKAECDLVHEIGKVVDQVESVVINAAHQVSEEVAQWVDGPTDCDDEAHGAEGSLHVLVHLVAGLSNLTCFASEDLVQYVAPTRHAEDESRPGIEEASLTTVPKCQHRHRAKHQAPKHRSTDASVHGGKDQIEFDHLQGNCDCPINVPIKDRRAANLHPELTHVEVVDCCDQGHQCTDVHGGLPMVRHTQGFHQEEHSSRYHGDGDDPERNRDGIVGIEESMQLLLGHILQRHDGTSKTEAPTP